MRLLDIFDNPATGKVYATRGDPTHAFHLTLVQFRAAR